MSATLFGPRHLRRTVLLEIINARSPEDYFCEIETNRNNRHSAQKAASSFAERRGAVNLSKVVSGR
ncbi:hypothetical protein IE4771_PB00128 (plasmid) [Rhizobium etli bv. mimosae str. IE4771]|uniref:Uncharacterized protein n=1 Tax=Rhizobium etli bv. mimosae str. IE4771 TaxID=1432050 RepID=A0A060I7X9_RHIET|nr:hypothetical protein IE4771_PB00128 [Rhizobium sp. IE4771]